MPEEQLLFKQETLSEVDPAANPPKNQKEKF